jgi:hypothetical protein
MIRRLLDDMTIAQLIDRLASPPGKITVDLAFVHARRIGRRSDQRYR